MKLSPTLLATLLLTTLSLTTLTPSAHASSATPSDQTTKKRWNFVFVMADDQGYNDLGCFGSPKIKTPHIDQMAKEGMKFTSFYTQPVCGPTRAALHTGCYPLRVAEVGNRKSLFPFLHVKEILLAKQLQEIGYQTGWIGKVDTTNRHRGYKPELNPSRRGYDYFYGVIGANDPGFVRLLHRNEELLAEVLEDITGLTQTYTQEAVAFIERNKDQPFMLYVAHTMPHVKLARSKAFEGVSERGVYGDVIEELDWSTGQIVQKIKDLGLEQNTIVIYASDNGPWHTRRYYPHDVGSAYPLRGSKGMTREGGVRVPCVMWGPGLIPADTSTDEIASIMDIFPTFINLAGGQLPPDRTIDGKSLAKVMSSKSGVKSPHQYLAFHHENQLEAIRSGKWKMVLPYAPVSERRWLRRGVLPGPFMPEIFVGNPTLQLFDLSKDMGETTNLADQHPEIIARLKGYAAETNEELGNYQQIGKGARFFEDSPKWPNLAKWRKTSAQSN